MALRNSCSFIQLTMRSRYHTFICIASYTVVNIFSNFPFGLIILTLVTAWSIWLAAWRCPGGFGRPVDFPTYDPQCKAGVHRTHWHYATCQHHGLLVVISQHSPCMLSLFCWSGRLQQGAGYVQVDDPAWHRSLYLQYRRREMFVSANFDQLEVSFERGELALV